jgi:hypothetical protein
MATWDENELSNEICPNCGMEYSVVFKKLPLRDDDRFVCTCGHVMRKWKETGMYMYQAISEKR